jgi:hypothetical protein
LNPVRAEGNSGEKRRVSERSEFSRVPDFPNERTHPEGGVMECTSQGHWLHLVTAKCWIPASRGNRP